ncbi:LLM class flavin-dependent oxidoreductase [Streptomyces sp. NPDC002886]|uniref:LLM class flavin-dependent oxidoreductase n=1 Tax=Streptomyces sp. NPDC002886 TaxID=3364667 RepID=UPI003674555F
MRFGLSYHHQLPRPWAADSEERMFNEALEQIELADRIGLDYAWATEHHFLEEYSHSGAPEVILAAASQRTKNIRLGHGIVQLPGAVNPPARVAERISTLDLISGGRVEFGTGQGSSQLELGAFNVERTTKREHWREALDIVVRMMTEEPFTGHKGEFFDIPPRNVVPKPKQKDHPPLWLACSARDTIENAARLGLGALSFSFSSPDQAKEHVDTYYSLISSEECRPAGRTVNPNFAVVVPFMCHEDQETALDRGLEGAHFFAYSLMHYFVFGQHKPGQTDVWQQFQATKEMLGFTREIAAPDDTPKAPGAEQMLEQITSLRRGIGTPEQIIDLLRQYEAAGVDQVIFSVQIGKNKHEHIMESLELFAREVLPHFTEGRDEREAEKAARLEVPIKEALGRVEVTTNDASDFVIDNELAIISQGS